MPSPSLTNKFSGQVSDSTQRFWGCPGAKAAPRAAPRRRRCDDPHMEFENTFDVPAPIDEVYAALLDVERVAPCVPGAEVLEQSGEDSYKVAIKVKVGPMSMKYMGDVEIVEKDESAHRAVMRAKAREARKQGTVNSLVVMQLTGAGGRTTGEISSEVQLSGHVATMGRGIMQDVSARIINKFSENLAAMLAGPGEAAAPAEAA